MYVSIFFQGFYSLSSLIYFELIFICGMKWGSNFIILHLDIRQSQHYLLKSYSFPIEWSQHPCQKSVERKHIFLDSQAYSCHHHACLMPAPRHVVYCCFVVSFGTVKYEPSQFALLFSRLFWLFWVPCKFHMNFKTNLLQIIAIIHIHCSRFEMCRKADKK